MGYNKLDSGTHNKIGFHAAVPGNLNGWGDYVRALDAAGIPAVVMSVGGGGIGDILAQWDSGSPVPHVVGARYMPPDGSQDVPPYGSNVRQAAVNWWGWLYPRIGNDVKAHRDKCWIVTGNELDKSQSDWLGRFYVELAAIMHAEGFKLCAFNFAPGEPEPAHWQTPGMLAYLQLCAERPQDTAVGLHEYALGDNLQAAYPHLIGRFESLHQVCDSRGIRRPSILITEWGWRQESVPAVNVAMAQLPFAAALYAQHANILGAGLWTLQNWHSGCIPNCVQALIAPIRDYTLTAVFPDPPPPPNQNKPKIIIVKKPQKAAMSQAENQSIGQWAWDNYGRTTTHSTDDTLTMLAGGNNESYAVIPYPARQAGDIAIIEAAGYRWQPMTAPPPAFAFTHWPTNDKRVTQRFMNNPAYYQQFGLPGHEGVDIAAATGSPITAVSSGTVSQINTNPAASNYGIFIRVNHGNNWETTYAHLQSVQTGLAVGTAVTGGQQLGKADSTGNAQGSHLHLTLKRIGQTFTDRCGRAWPYNIHDPEPFMTHFTGVTWPAPVNCPPPPGQQYDMLNYIIGKRDGRATQFSSGETMQYQEAGGWQYLVKNSQWEQFRFDTNFIWRAKDTSPGPAPQNAERPGAARWYNQTEAGQNAARWCPRLMAVGQVWTGLGHTVQFYYKSDCAPSAINSGGATNKATLIAHHTSKTWGNITVQDVIEFRGAGAETFFFARDWGMVAWSSAWGQSHVIELFQPGQRTLTRESGCFG